MIAAITIAVRRKREKEKNSQIEQSQNAKGLPTSYLPDTQECFAFNGRGCTLS